MLRGIYTSVMLALPDPASARVAPPSRRELRWAMLAHLLTPLTAWMLLGFVPPLVIRLTVGRDSAYVRGHCVSSLNFQLSTLLYVGVALLLRLITFGVAWAVLGPIAVLYGAFFLIVVLIASLKAANADHFDYPLTLPLLTHTPQPPR